MHGHIVNFLIVLAVLFAGLVAYSYLSKPSA